eukprot:NODE_870_length_572_cov_427.182022_g860_i0.p2 GENE.NODE_870_length_572_cov_427.182022_g860_i0~~NODE_870_length_572_cov_427.182022_g860_i0.p2  ORF type:complete len:53 (+),score=26.07 NODE_870_length_572_cov_427.182022_g860_i0:2-160(+)
MFIRDRRRVFFFFFFFFFASPVFRILKHLPLNFFQKKLLFHQNRNTGVRTRQ